jgi:hypothetical protein
VAAKLNEYKPLLRVGGVRAVVTGETMVILTTLEVPETPEAVATAVRE